MELATDANLQWQVLNDQDHNLARVAIFVTVSPISVGCPFQTGRNNLKFRSRPQWSQYDPIWYDLSPQRGTLDFLIYKNTSLSWPLPVSYGCLLEVILFEIDSYNLTIIRMSHESWRFKSSTTPLCGQPFLQAKIKENIKAPYHWPFERGIHRWQVGFHHKDQ